MKGTDHWHEVSASTIGRIAEQSATGFTFFYSPRDVPAAWRAISEPREGGAHDEIIEFKYLSSPEHTQKKSAGKFIDLEIGKSSGRIHRILVHVSDSSLRESFAQVLISAFSELSKEPKLREHLRPGNLGSIQAIVATEQELLELFDTGSDRE